MSLVSFSQDLEKLKTVVPEKQSLFLFNTISTHYRNLALVDLTLLNAQASTLLDDLIVSLRSPGVHRAHRNLVGRCFVTMFRRIDKGPFETTNKIITLLQREKDEKYKWNTVVVLGIIFESVGDQISSLLGELIATMTKVIKAASNSPGLKAGAFNAIGAALSKTSQLDDANNREVLRIIKSCLPDKANVVHTAAYDCLNELIICSGELNDETVQNMILKNFESATYKGVRAAAARCLASLHLKILLMSQTTDDSEQKYVVRMFATLSTIHNKTLFRKVRSVVIVAYQEIFHRMGSSWISQYHEQIITSVLNDLQLAIPPSDRHRALTTRRHVQILLRQVHDCLDQEAQIVALNRILAIIRTAPSRHILVSCLSEMTRLIRSLGSATPVDLEFDPIYFLMAHPVHSVQVATALTAKTIVLNVPSMLSNMVANVFDRLKQELATVSDAEGTAKNADCVGLAFSLAALTAAGVARPLYISLDKTASQILNLANDTLKASSKSTIHVAGVQVQVAWTLIGALQSLGATFVRSHLSQLLLLWKNALPKPLAKEMQFDGEKLYLLHVRDTALSSIYAFLKNCRPLCTTDVIKRLSTMVSNSLAFLQTLYIPPPALLEKTFFSLTASELEARLRRRVLSCLIEIQGIGGNELEESIVAALSSFADPKVYGATPLSYTNLWEMTDNYAFGLVSACKVPEAVDDLLEVPVLDALEHNYVQLFVESESEECPPAENQVADYGIQLFAKSFHKQNAQVQESLLAQMGSLLVAPQNLRSAGRKAAVQINCLLAISRILSKEDLDPVPAKTAFAITELILDGLASSDAFVRDTASETFGRLALIGGSATTTSQVNELIDRIVKDRDPFVRAGCTSALGYIHKFLGGIAAVYHLKSILNVLVSLANDPHPIVHYHAISALKRTIESSGLSFTAHTNSTLALILKLYVSDVLDAEAGTVASSNLAIELPHYHALALCADGLINIIGPDLEDNTTARELLLKFVGELLVEKDSQLIADGLICTQHLALFAAKQLDLTSYIISLHYHLHSSNELIQQATMDGLYQLMRVDANQVIRQSSITTRFDTALWLLLNSRPGSQTVMDIIHAWLSQTKHEFVYWTELFQQILIRQRLSETNKDAAPKPRLVEQSVEDEGSSLGNAATQQESKDEMLRWQTRLFALQCLHELVLSIPAETLGHKIADLVRMAFSASTSKVVVLQIEGLKFLRSIIAHFKALRDPDFPEVALLEQHQAQLGSALTPAFSADSCPDVAALAVHVCAEFIASGIVENVERMGRILRMLNNALDSCRDPESSSFEALKHYAENAKSMIRISILSSWAELQVSSMKQEYLTEVVSPYVKELTPMWLDSLKDYAQLKFEPTTSGNSMEVQYSTLSRETMVNFYSRAWLNFVHAIATLVDQDKDFVFNALDNRSTTNGHVGEIDYREEPAAFFLVLFGICFEALAHSSMESSGNEDQNIEILTALQSILRPSICGTVVYTEPIFTEIVDLFGRLILTEGLATQVVIVDIVANLAQNHPLSSTSADNLENPESERVQEYVDQLFDLARLTILPLTIVFSWDRTENGKEVSRVHASLPRLARSCLSHFVILAEKFPPVIKLDLYNSLFHVFGNVFCSATTQATVVPAILPPFKNFTHNVSQGLKANIDDAGMIFGPTRHFLHKLVVSEPTSSVHANNNILASTILITNLGHLLPSKDKLVTQFASFIIRHLSLEETQKSAVWSLKSLITIKDDRLQSFSRQIFVALSNIVIQQQSTSHHSLILLFDFCEAKLQVSESATIASSLQCLVPLLLIYDTTTQDTQLQRKLVAGRLLHIVSRDSSGFKSFVDSLPTDQKEALLGILKSGMDNQGPKKEEAGPSINLRVAFEY